MIKKKVINTIQKSFEELKEMNPSIKKNFSQNIVIKGKKTFFDSVDLVTFFSILEKNAKKDGLKTPNFLDENFYFKFSNLTFYDLTKFFDEKQKKK